MKKLLLLLIFCSVNLFAQEYGPGRVIPDYGKTFTVKDPEFKTDTSTPLKAVIDVDRQFDPSAPNKLIETAARYLNMHEKAGVPLKNMEVALVIHGSAVFDIMKDEYYTKKYPSLKSNPNLPLLKALSAQGVSIIVCGQSAAHHGVSRQKADDHVKFALSAMTALVQLQNRDYQLIKF